MTKRRTLTDEKEYNGKPILTDKQKELRCDKKILKRIDQTVAHLIEDHKLDRIFVAHYEIRYPQDHEVACEEKNEDFRDAQSKLIKHYDRKGYDPHYIAVREKKDCEKHHHYHLFFFMDERKINNSWSAAKKLDSFWASSIGKPDKLALVENCSKGGKSHTLKINSPEFEEQGKKLMQHASYLAKPTQKKFNDGKRELFSSRLKHKIKKKEQGR